jgi:hypothetical protein
MKYTSGYKYQLCEQDSIQTDIFPNQNIDTEFIHLNTNGLLVLNSGYASDGPSGPTIDTPTSIRGAFFHDAIYQLIRMELLPAHWKKQADKLAHRLWVEDGMYKWRAALWHREIKKFAGFAADPKNRKKIHTTPVPKPERWQP